MQLITFPNKKSSIRWLWNDGVFFHNHTTIKKLNVESTIILLWIYCAFFRWLCFECGIFSRKKTQSDCVVLEHSQNRHTATIKTTIIDVANFRKIASKCGFDCGICYQWLWNYCDFDCGFHIQVTKNYNRPPATPRAAPECGFDCGMIVLLIVVSLNHIHKFVISNSQSWIPKYILKQFFEN